MVCTAAAFTMYQYRAGFDATAGVWNLAGLAAHITLAVGLGFLLIYLDSLRRLEVPKRTATIYLAVTAVVIIVMIGSWLAAPVHDRDVADLLDLPANGAVAVYCIAFWAFLACVLLTMTRTCLARGRTFRHEDLARSISMVLIGASALTAIPVVLLWSISLLVRNRGGSPGRLNAIGDALLPWAVLLNALGVLCLLTVPYLASLIRAWLHLRRLRPLWSALVHRYPWVHLPLRLTGGPLTRLQTLVERAIIETRDALRIARIDVPAGQVSVESIARALRTSAGGSRNVADLLDRSETREADLDQLMALSQAFEKAGRAFA